MLAPILFKMFIDHVMRMASARLPHAGCSFKYRVGDDWYTYDDIREKLSPYRDPPRAGHLLNMKMCMFTCVAPLC